MAYPDLVCEPMRVGVGVWQFLMDQADTSGYDTSRITNSDRGARTGPRNLE